MSLAFVDVETNGTHAEARIIEIAVIAIDGETNETKTFSSFVRGDGNSGPQWIHGIKDEDLESAPPFAEVWPKVSELLQGHVVVAHNATFDRRRINYELNKIGEKELPKFFCTMRMAYSLGYAKRRSAGEPGLSAKLGDLAIRLSVATQPNHRAPADTESCKGLFEYLIEHHPQDVLTELKGLEAVGVLKQQVSSVDTRQPVVVIVDAANINERRRGRQWYKYPETREFQLWSYEHFSDFRESLELHLPGAVIISFFDDTSTERCASFHDKDSLSYSFKQAAHENTKIFKVPSPYKSDDIIFALAKELRAFVISGDHFIDQEDSDNWTRKEMQFYSQFPVDTQQWRFMNKNDIDSAKSRAQTIAEAVELLNLRSVSVVEREEVLNYVESFSRNFFNDSRNTPKRRLRARFNTRPLSNTISIGNIKLSDEPSRKRQSVFRSRAYNIPALRKYLKNRVTVVGRLSESDSTIYLEWFKSYKPIKVMPEDTDTFRERLQFSHFFEISGDLEESSGFLILKKARIERLLSFSDLTRRMPESMGRVASFPKFRTARRSKPHISKTQPTHVAQQRLVAPSPPQTQVNYSLEDFLASDLPDPRRKQASRRGRVVIALILIAISLVVVFFFGDVFQFFFGLVEIPTLSNAQVTPIHLTFR